MRRAYRLGFSAKVSGVLVLTVVFWRLTVSVPSAPMVIRVGDAAPKVSWNLLKATLPTPGFKFSAVDPLTAALPVGRARMGWKPEVTPVMGL